MTKGTLIVIDALDGAGKETQTELLAEYLYRVGVDFKVVSFPNYDSESSYGIQKLLKGNIGNVNVYGNSILYTYDRLLTMTNPDTLEGHKSIIDFYNEGGLVICDRYTSSNVLYQTIDMGYEETIKYIEWLEGLEYDTLELPRPDAILMLNVEPEVSMQNIEKRGKGHDNYETLERLTKVYDKINMLERMEYPMNIINCTDNGEMKSREDIHKLIVEKVETIYGIEKQI